MLTSGDFGRAYLVEQWAARFASELFRNYAVCFVGYSIDDPVMRYMVDAIAADRQRGEQIHPAYALGDYESGKKQQKADEWRAKNVIPILYANDAQHGHLHRTIREWARLYSEGVRGKEAIVDTYARKDPRESTPRDNFIGRMCWALSDKSAAPAKWFAKIDPPPPLSWLEELAKDRYDVASTEKQLQAGAVTGDSGRWGVLCGTAPFRLMQPIELLSDENKASRLDNITSYVGHWLAKHIDNPELVLWVAKGGGVLHPVFAEQIRGALNKLSVCPVMRTVWELVLAGKLLRRRFYDHGHGWAAQVETSGFSSELRLQLRGLLRPRVHIKNARRIEPTEATRVFELFDCDVVLGIEPPLKRSLQVAFPDLPWATMLPALLDDATALLRDAMDLLSSLGLANERLHWSFGDIHDLHNPKEEELACASDWAVLLSLARDAWVEVAKTNPTRARVEAERWWSFPYPVFKRLALFAAAHGSAIDPSLGCTWLLADDGRWLFFDQTKGEVLPLIRLLASTGSWPDIERAILRGPQPERRDGEREIWLRLDAAQKSGAVLGDEASAWLRELNQRTFRTESQERSVLEATGGFADDPEIMALIPPEVTPVRRRELVAWLRAHEVPQASSPDDWSRRCSKDFATTVCALYELAQSNEWPTTRWREALVAWSSGKVPKRPWGRIVHWLRDAPDSFIQTLASELSLWLASVAPNLARHEDAFFTLLKRVLQLAQEQGSGVSSNEPVLVASNHPVGRVTNAIVQWWYRQTLNDGQKLPAEIEPVFTKLCDPAIAGFEHGRVVLARHLVTLFRVDQAWTTEHLLPRFDWHDEIEACRMWCGCLSSTPINEPVMRSLRQSFLETAKHYDALGERAANYARMLTFVAVDHHDLVSIDELHEATCALSIKGLEATAEMLAGLASNTPEHQSVAHWQNRILPYLQNVWPHFNDRHSKDIARHFAVLCTLTGDAFPEALRQVWPWLEPVDLFEQVIHPMRLHNICMRFPEGALKLLDVVVDRQWSWRTKELRECLDAIAKADPPLTSDRRFKNLMIEVEKRT